ncbi:proline/glycine betaine transporter [compost metagenome]
MVVVADPAQCAFQFDPVGKAKFTSSCDIAKSVLAKRAIPYTNEKAEPGSVTQIRIGERVIPSFDGRSLPAADFKTQNEAFSATLGGALKEAGYPEKADPAKIHYPMVLLLLTILVIYVTMVYGPIAAWLVELFPARIRYTSMSLPYHIGNGWFGGFLPTVAFAMVAATGDIYYGLWYPIVIAVMTAILGIFFLPETKDRDINHT